MTARTTARRPTHAADQDRARQVRALASTAELIGLMPYELTVVGGTAADADRWHRVWRTHLGWQHAPSVETRVEAVRALEVRCWALAGVVPCPDGCGWPVRLMTTAAGRTLAIDPLPRQDGTVWRQSARGKGPVAVILAGHQTPPDAEPLYRQHSRSCPATSTKRVREAPRCTACGERLDAVLAGRDPTYTTHPTCAPDP
ncbi:hypothetical protein [Cellulomonas timonensis]|uniref:hypothetical protein n=1 Tax=Cellulomonas timonensis TaxID=1689271 RepID=UPI000836776A|nr:hypothetical protein [Cellulomonas timonensis]